jgi:hypothetical protein
VIGAEADPSLRAVLPGWLREAVCLEVFGLLAELRQVRCASGFSFISEREASAPVSRS